MKREKEKTMNIQGLYDKYQKWRADQSRLCKDSDLQMTPPYELVDERTIVNTCDFKRTKTYTAQLQPPRGEQGATDNTEKLYFPVLYGQRMVIFIGKYTGSMQVKVCIQIIMGN